MYKAIKENKIIAISETDSEFLLMDKDDVEGDPTHTCEDYEQVNGEYLLKQGNPIDYQKEQIRKQRQERYQNEADPIRYDYEEALARDEHEAVDLKRAWLAKKDEIRADLPYPDEGEE